jgi:hypothetical protein
MTCMIFSVSEKPSGWFVMGHDEIGPFISRQLAVDLANGMVAAIRAAGQDARLLMEAAAPKVVVQWVRGGSEARPFSRLA